MNHEESLRDQRIILAAALPGVDYHAIWDAVDYLADQGYAVVPVPAEPEGEPEPDCGDCGKGVDACGCPGGPVAPAPTSTPGSGCGWCDRGSDVWPCPRCGKPDCDYTPRNPCPLPAPDPDDDPDGCPRCGWAEEYMP